MSEPLLPSVSAIQPLDPGRDDEAAAILAACTVEGTPERGGELLTAFRGDEAVSIYGLVEQGELVAVCALRKVSMANELAAIAVAPERRRQGHGRTCLQDALRRSGRRPLVAETDEEALGFYKACGFKLVGRRTRPDGSVRYRLGWHAPVARKPSDGA